METKRTIRLHRTNEKPVGFRVVDKPEYNVSFNGEIIGQIACRLVRESRHYSAGYVKTWSAVRGSKRQYHYANKDSARDQVVAWFEAERAAQVS